jgi:hypothetical protein
MLAVLHSDVSYSHSRIFSCTPSRVARPLVPPSQVLSHISDATLLICLNSKVSTQSTSVTTSMSMNFNNKYRKYILLCTYQLWASSYLCYICLPSPISLFIYLFVFLFDLQIGVDVYIHYSFHWCFIFVFQRLMIDDWWLMTDDWPQVGIVPCLLFLSHCMLLVEVFPALVGFSLMPMYFLHVGSSSLRVDDSLVHMLSCIIHYACPNAPRFPRFGLSHIGHWLHVSRIYACVPHLSTS